MSRSVQAAQAGPSDADYLRLDDLRQAPLAIKPYEHIVLEGFLRPDAQDEILRDYPDIEAPGSFPLSELSVGASVTRLIDELNGPAFRQIVEQKFGIPLKGYPTMFTLRGKCSQRDGRIHTDSKKKLITVLLYLNPPWETEGGRLRLLNNGEDIEAVAREIPPDYGTLLIFRRSNHSWHGHHAFVGPRKVLQMNWVVSEQIHAWEQFRHRVSAAFKRLKRQAA